MLTDFFPLILFVVTINAVGAQIPDASSTRTGQTLTGRAAFTDYSKEKPGVMRKITLADLPQPENTESINNHPRVILRPTNAWPQAPAEFKVELYTNQLDRPRLIRTAPNGDIFVAESYAGKVIVLRGVDHNGKPEQMQVFVTGLRRPFGIAFYPPVANPEWVYIANTDSVVRFPYRNGDLTARGRPQTIITNLPSGAGLLGGAGHWTRDIVFSPDGRKMFVSVGSYSNDDDTDNNPRERNRADILEYNPDGTGLRVYAYGIRNAVGIAIQPNSAKLWASVNERDGLGDDLPPDYITYVPEGGFYGWPWYYMGGHQDPKHAGKHPELKDKVATPDVLLQPHFASLEMTFYDGAQFPTEYRGSIFAAEHGSWNRRRRAGYEVIRIPVKNGRATGEYEDFVTGFVTPNGNVWGRPAGVTVAKDGSLLVSDDASNSIWRVTYTGK